MQAKKLPQLARELAIEVLKSRRTPLPVSIAQHLGPHSTPKRRSGSYRDRARLPPPVSAGFTENFPPRARPAPETTQRLREEGGR